MRPNTATVAKREFAGTGSVRNWAEIFVTATSVGHLTVVDRIAMKSRRLVSVDGQEKWRTRVHDFLVCEGIDIEELHDDAWARSRAGWPKSQRPDELLP